MAHFFKRVFQYLVMDTVEAAKPLTVGRRYRHFRRTLLLIMTAVTMIPLVVTSVFSYHKYKRLLEEETVKYLSWNAESADKIIDAFVEELRSVIVFITEEYSHEELASQEKLSTLFVRLKNKHSGFVDLGYIDPNGVQRAYAGPFDFRGKKYRNMSWFKETLSRGNTVSDVFLGYRNLPHFVVSISKKVPGKEEYWVLRASVDAETLEKFILTIDTKAADDLFLVNHSGVLQTSSRYYGKIQDEYPLGVLPRKSGVSLRVEESEAVSKIEAQTYIKGTPWILVLVKHGFINKKVWSLFQAELVGIVLVSALIVFVVILRTANILGERIRKADEKRENMLSEVEHTSKLASIGRLAAGVAHEINNPLAIISEKTGLVKDLLELSDDFTHKEKISQQVEGVSSAVQRCKVITHRLLGFARRMDVSLESIDINQVLREVWGFLEKEALYRGTQLELDLDAALPLVESDRGQLQQIFLNLLNNAIDAVGQEGAITVRTRLRDSENLQVEIIDNGPGMSPDIINHIFEPFFTTKTSGEKRGTGLGLSITYGLVKKLGSEILVDSVVGKGTTFTIILPLKHTMRRRKIDD